MVQPGILEGDLLAQLPLDRILIHRPVRPKRREKEDVLIFDPAGCQLGHHVRCDRISRSCACRVVKGDNRVGLAGGELAQRRRADGLLYGSQDLLRRQRGGAFALHSHHVERPVDGKIQALIEVSVELVRGDDHRVGGALQRGDIRRLVGAGGECRANQRNRAGSPGTLHKTSAGKD